VNPTTKSLFYGMGIAEFALKKGKTAIMMMAYLVGIQIKKDFRWKQ